MFQCRVLVIKLDLSLLGDSFEQVGDEVWVKIASKDPGNEWNDQFCKESKQVEKSTNVSEEVEKAVDRSTLCDNVSVEKKVDLMYRV